jgi:hypothetical protein
MGATVILGVLGCQHQQDLKPAWQPEVLSSPTDPRYAKDARYPASALDNDPIKAKVQQDLMNNKGGMTRPASMGMGGGMAPG